MRHLVFFLCIPLILFTVGRPADAGEPATLDIYFLDMVGGGSTLIVTPMGESVLIDTGSLEPKHRDADRIRRACEVAGVKKIDHLITTHFHSDHYGGLPELARHLPIKTFWDKGALPPSFEQESRSFRELYPLYRQVTQGKVKPLRAGADVPLRDDPAGRTPAVNLHCVAAEKKVEGFEGDIDAPVDGFRMEKPDDSDNARSIALLLTYGPFKFFAGGDITWNVEHHLAHPVNRIGKVDLYQVTHHGLDQSNNTRLLQALDPTVAVAMNGPRKGIMPRTFKDLTALPHLKALYQIHCNTQYGDEGNTWPEFIANPKDNPDRGEFIKASVDAERGTFTVRIGRDGAPRTCKIQRANPSAGQTPKLPAPPDLGGCTRVEIRYYPSTFEYFFRDAGDTALLSPAEIERLQSLETVTVDDPKFCRMLARDVSRGQYRGRTDTAIPTGDLMRLVCYRGRERLASLLAIGKQTVEDERKRWFTCDDGLPSLHQPPKPIQPLVWRADCARRLRVLHDVLKAYYAHHGSVLPAPAQWCDALARFCRETRQTDLRADFKCPGGHEGRCHYALNPECRPDSPPDTVLLFETNAGWNQCGGPELFTFDHHDPPGGCVLLKGVDLGRPGSEVKFIRTQEQLRQLRWR